MTPQSHVNDLIKITSRLIAVLEREVELLRTTRPAEIEDLQQEKTVLTAAYESQAKSLAGRPELLDGVQPVLRTELTQTIDKFQSTLAKNERALRAARDTTHRVLKAIADEIDRKRRENAGYAAVNNGAAPAQPGAQRPVSVAIDERF